MKRFLHWSNLVIDARLGTLGALIMGLIVYFINQSYGFMPALIAALKQALYTFFVGGIMLRLLEFLAIRIPNKILSVVLSALLVATLTCTLVYGVHRFKGTPRPWESTLPTVYLAPISFVAIAWRKRNKWEGKLEGGMEESVI